MGGWTLWNYTDSFKFILALNILLSTLQVRPIASELNK